MLTYTAERLMQMLLVLFMAVTVVFFLIRLSGDPVLLFMPPDASRDQIETFRAQLGYDRPLLIQYADFLVKAAQGDFGVSLRRRSDAMELVLERVPATFQLAFAGLALSLVMALPLGMLSAYYRNSVFDRIGVGGTVLAQAVPGFWLGLLLIYVFAVQLRWLPTSGSGDLAHLILPAVTLGAYSLARFARFTRSTMIDVLRQNYIRTARASGASLWRLLTKYALKNTLIPLVTIIGLDLGTMLGGAVITETIFAWPGLGRLMMESLLARDFPVVIAGVFFIAAMFAVINCVVDLLYGVLNPQIRLGRRA